jgi:phosphoesterase RecJ-like protein
VDTGTWQQLAGMEPLVGHSGAPVLLIDHHQTWDPLSDFQLVDPGAVAAAVVVHRLLTETGAEIDPTTAMYLFTGLAVDTDWFRLATVDAATLRLAASLVEAGAQPAEIYDRLYMSDDFARAQLRGRAIETLHPALDGRAMVMRLTQGLFREVGADIGDTENLINECMRIRGVRVGLMLTEAEGDDVRVSLRSRPPVDILQVAKHFGGGGHHRAAGAMGRGPMDRVEAEVLALVAEALAEADAGNVSQ